MPKIKDEISALLDSTLEDIKNKKKEEIEEEDTEEQEELETEEETEEDETETDEEETEEETEEEEDPNQSLKDELAELKDQIADLKKPKEEKKKPAEVKFDDIVVASEGDFEDITDSHESLNKFANKVSQRTQENILKALPNIINNLVTQSVTLQTSVTEFWRNNEDLVAGKNQREINEVKKKIGSFSNAILAADPTKTYGEVFEEAGNIIRGNGRKPRIKKKKVAAVRTPGSSKKKVIKGKAVTTSDKIDDLFES